MKRFKKESKVLILKNQIKKIAQKAVKVSGKLLLLVAVLAASWTIPTAHKEYIGYKTSKMVHMIHTPNMRGGGTGFSVIAPSGKSYILTNSHICAAGKQTGKLPVTRHAGDRPVWKRIIEDSDNTDLCLLEGFGEDGLNIADSVEMREGIAVVGHPLLNPLVIRRGEIIGQEEVKIPVGVHPGEFKEGECSLPKNEKMKAHIFGIPFAVCLVKIDAYNTDLEAYPGNSGSPVVNKWGNVVGVLFASNDRSNWALLVTLEQVKEFLALY